MGLNLIRIFLGMGTGLVLGAGVGFALGAGMEFVLGAGTVNLPSVWVSSLERILP